ncbi:MAG: DUF2029 domain-containing protein [Bacteroidetes bacterium]|nr:DUF2029 domain-containing protein [Bacteroidota bacterium]MCL5737394.1 DUF2029 domain-containing protein [Bacteroidota bacterium]
MRLVARIFVLVSALFIVLYGVLPGFFRVEGNFIPIYVAGKNFLLGLNPILFYRFPDFQKLIDASGLSNGIFSFAVSTPPSILVNSIVALPSPAISRFLLTGANVAAFVLLVHASSKVANSSVGMAYMVSLSSSFALAANFRSSEPFIILTLLFVLAFYSLVINAEGAAGVLLGLIFPFKVFAAIPAVLFLLSKKWRAFLYFVITSVIVLIFTYLIVGKPTIVYYLQKVFPFYINGRIQNPYSISYQTAWSFFRRIFVFDNTLNIHPLIQSRSAYVLAISIFKAIIVVPSAYFFYKGIERKSPRESLIAATFPIIFLSPTGTTFELVLLAPAVISLVQIALSEGNTKIARLFLVLYALSCLPIFAALEIYLKVSSPFLLYERFFLLIVLYAFYLSFQLRLVPRHLWAIRTIITASIAAAVTVTLYFGDRSSVNTSSLPVTPALKGVELKSIAFSPGLNEGKLTYVGYDSASRHFAPYRVPLKELESSSQDRIAGNCYRFVSDQHGENYAIETTKEEQTVSYFRIEEAAASFNGTAPSVSAEGDYGAFLKNGKLYIVGLPSRHIVVVDSVALLPFRITKFAFNNSRNSDIVFVIDSLNASHSIGTYDLFDHSLATVPAPFHISLLCADGENFFASLEAKDSTSVWSFKSNTAPTKLFAVHGSVEDMTVINHELYFSSDFERGLDFPTVYKYTSLTTLPAQK